MEKFSDEEVAARLKQIRANISRAAERAGRDPSEITLMAVTKTVPPARVNAAIEGGVTLLGENRVQEYLEKKDSYLPAEVHFIGNLQTNKVKYIIDKVSMIQSVSSRKLAEEIEKQAEKHDLIMPVLLEVNVGGEESKSGFSPEELEEALFWAQQRPHLLVRGLMCIPPAEDSEKFLAKMEQIFIDIRRKNPHNSNVNVLSMGMSGDYEAAVVHGATLVRIGSALFGKRDYSKQAVETHK